MSTTTITLPTGQIGINLAPIGDSGGDYPLANAFRSTSFWYTYSLATPDAYYSNVGQAPVDANGWPTTDFASQPLAGGTTVFGGAYLLTCTGKYDVLANTYGGPAASLPAGRTAYYDPATNTTKVIYTIPPGSDFVGTWRLFFGNTRRLPSDTTATGLKDLCLWRALDPNNPGKTEADFHGPGDIFTHGYISLIKNSFDFCRMMEWCQVTNITKDPWEWTDRTKPGDFFLAIQSKGFCLEYMILFCNLTRTDCWLCTVHSITDDARHKFALACMYGTDGVLPYTGPAGSTGSNPVPSSGPLFPPLDPGLNYYIERSNETWNSQFTAYNWDLNYVANAPASNPVKYDGTTNFGSIGVLQRAQVYGTVQNSVAFRSAFGDAAMGSRVKILLGAQQNSNPNIAAFGSADQLLEYLNGYWNNGYGSYVSVPQPPSYYIWGVAAGAYRLMGVSVVDPANPLGLNIGLGTDPQGVLDHTHWTSDPHKTLAQNATDAIFSTGMCLLDYERSSLLAQCYGVKQIIYEGAITNCDSAVNDFTLAVNADPRMQALTTQNAQEAMNSGANPCHYNTDNNNWRLWQYSYNPITPRLLGYQAISSKAGHPYTPQRIITNAGPESISPAVLTLFPGALLPLGLRYFAAATMIGVDVQGYLNAASSGPSLALEVDGTPVATGVLPFPATDLVPNTTTHLVGSVPAGAHTIAVRAIGPVQFRYGTPINVVYPGPTIYGDKTIDADNFTNLADGDLLDTQAGAVWTRTSDHNIPLAYNAAQTGLIPALANFPYNTTISYDRAAALTSVYPAVEAQFDLRNTAIWCYVSLRLPDGTQVNGGIYANTGYIDTSAGRTQLGLLLLTNGNSGNFVVRLEWTGTTARLLINGFEVGTVPVTVAATAGAKAGIGIYGPQVTDPNESLVIRSFRAVNRVAGAGTFNPVLGSAWLDRLLRHGT